MRFSPYALGIFTRIGRLGCWCAQLNEPLGRLVSWLTLAMVLVAAAVAVLRYVFSIGFVAMQESYVWMHGVVIMLGAGYTLRHEGQVRIDILYRSMTARGRARVNLFGTFFLLFPMLLVIAAVSWGYVRASWGRLEGSREVGGLPGLFLLKSTILLFCFCLAVEGARLAFRSWHILRRHDEDAPDPQGAAPP